MFLRVTKGLKREEKRNREEKKELEEGEREREREREKERETLIPSSVSITLHRRNQQVLSSVQSQIMNSHLSPLPTILSNIFVWLPGQLLDG